MRKLTEQAVTAFENNENFKKSNTSVLIKDGKTKLFLHNNLIAKKEDGKLFITNAGWKTRTTKERLNGLKEVSIAQAKGKWYLNGNYWKGELIEVK